MCGRFALSVTPAVFEEWFETVGGVDPYPRFNIAPTQPFLVVLERETGRKAELMRWGFVPGWVKDPRDFPLIINARAETVLDKPAFRGSLRHHRCIVPASGYYEWRTNADGKKQPFYIQMKNGEPMAFAGVYSSWMGPDGEEVDTVAIVTVPSNADLSIVHHRMPALVPKEALKDWLDVHNVDAKTAYALLMPAPTGLVTSGPVSTRVNSVKNDDERLVEAADEIPVAPPKQASGQMDLF